MKLRPPTARSVWKTASSPRTAQPKTSDLAPAIAYPENWWDNCRRLPKIPIRPRSPRVENLPCCHPDPDRPAAGLHVGTRAFVTSGRQRRSAAGSSNYSADRATAHRGADADGGNATASVWPDRYARTDGYGDPRADPADGTGTNCHANPADAYRGATYTPADTHPTASPTDGYGNAYHSYTGVTRHGVSHPVEPP